MDVSRVRYESHFIDRMAHGGGNALIRTAYTYVRIRKYVYGRVRLYVRIRKSVHGRIFYPVRIRSSVYGRIHIRRPY